MKFPCKHTADDTHNQDNLPLFYPNTGIPQEKNGQCSGHKRDKTTPNQHVYQELEKFASHLKETSLLGTLIIAKNYLGDFHVH